jgi:hypothetical protein
MRRSGLRDDQWDWIKDLQPGRKGCRRRCGGLSIVHRSGSLPISSWYPLPTEHFSDWQNHYMMYRRHHRARSPVPAGARESTCITARPWQPRARPLVRSLRPHGKCQQSRVTSSAWHSRPAPLTNRRRRGRRDCGCTGFSRELRHKQFPDKILRGQSATVKALTA